MKIKNNLISGLCASIGGVLTKIAFSFGDDGMITEKFIPVLRSHGSIDLLNFNFGA